ncbi:MAG: DUF1702 family protein [Cytophagales bacterium]|nr:DUF1702 family protein [Cytophagales bacterium]
MESQALISFKMGEIKSIFQSAKDYATTNENLQDIRSYLDAADYEFKSVAFEGVSMALALKDLNRGNALIQWNNFLTHEGKNHAVQVHAGLGWALAQENIPAVDFVDALTPLMRYRILDGYGYYNGIVKQRQTIKEKRILDWLTGTSYNVYYQGVGRSIYYLHAGDIQKVKEVILTFPESNLEDLWRGVGVACADVGGCREQMLEAMLESAGNFRPQLAACACMVARARKQSQTLTEDIEVTCKIWCDRSVEEIIEVTERLIPLKHLPEEQYGIWIRAIENEFKVLA